MSKKKDSSDDWIEVWGAKSHNLKNIDIAIPRNELVVITGLSGSGKSSLAFDTIFAEGQRRYMETFSAYARQFIGNLQRPEVDKITGLSPVISIEQKTVSKNPRSTVGTITEIYDFLRLLFARAGTAYSPSTGKPLVKYSEKQIIDLVIKKFNEEKIIISAPIVRSRKGHYRELFESLFKQGFTKVVVDGEATDIVKGLKLDRYKTHDIDLIVDRIKTKKEADQRLIEAIRLALKKGDGMMKITLHQSGDSFNFSQTLTCPDSGFSIAEPEPNSFSFNSPKGACPKCHGLGQTTEIDLKKIFPDSNLSVKKEVSLHSGNMNPIGYFKK